MPRSCHPHLIPRAFLKLIFSHLLMQRLVRPLRCCRLRCVLSKGKSALQLDGIRVRVVASFLQSSQLHTIRRSLLYRRRQHLPFAQDTAGSGLCLSDQRRGFLSAYTRLSSHADAVLPNDSLCPAQFYERPEVHGRQCWQQYRLPIHSNHK